MASKAELGKLARDWFRQHGLPEAEIYFDRASGLASTPLVLNCRITYTEAELRANEGPAFEELLRGKALAALADCRAELDTIEASLTGKGKDNTR